MNRYFDTFLKLAVIVILVLAAITKQYYNYYAFVRWSVFISSIYLAYKSRQNGSVAIILFLAFAVLFNPFRIFMFRKGTWGVIDLIVAALILLTIDWKGHRESLTPKGKLIHKLVKDYILGIIALSVAVWFYFNETGNPYHEFLLITNATTANGFIAYSEEQENTVETEGGSYEVYHVYYEYKFTTKEGMTIEDHGTTTSPESGYLSEANHKAIPIVVEYISSNPQINRIKRMNTQCLTITEFIWRRIALAGLLLIVFCSIGFVMTKNAIKEYVTERKENP